MSKPLARGYLARRSGPMWELHEEDLERLRAVIARGLASWKDLRALMISSQQTDVAIRLLERRGLASFKGSFYCRQLQREAGWVFDPEARKQYEEGRALRDAGAACPSFRKRSDLRLYWGWKDRDAELRPQTPPLPAWAYEAGRAAWASSGNHAVNPYEPGSPYRRAWRRGHQEARDEELAARCGLKEAPRG